MTGTSGLIMKTCAAVRVGRGSLGNVATHMHTHTPTHLHKLPGVVLVPLGQYSEQTHNRMDRVGSGAVTMETLHSH